MGLAERETNLLIAELRVGLSYRTIESLSLQSGIAVEDIASLIELPQRTLARRKHAGRLNPGESERLLRLSRAFEGAVGLFEGNVEGAVAWLKKPNRALADKAPWDYLQTEIGAREVENLIGRLEHGVFT